MVDKFAHTEVKGYGMPAMIEVDAYRKGVNDTLRLSLNLEKESEQNPAWSEEDEKMLVGCIQAMCTPDDYSLNDRINFESWLKSLKDKVQPQTKYIK